MNKIHQAKRVHVNRYRVRFWQVPFRQFLFWQPLLQLMLHYSMLTAVKM